MSKIIIFLFLISFGFLSSDNHSEKNNHTHSAVSKNKSVNLKSSTVATSPDYSKNFSEDSSNIMFEVNDIVNQKLLGALALNSMHSFFSAERIINVGAVFIRLIIIFIIFAIVWKAVNRFTLRIVSSIIAKTKKHSGSYNSSNSIANTAGPIINSVLHWFITGITALITLSQLGLDIMPIIYSFGVFSLAISIGAQTLVKDIISGVLTLFEGIVAVGETVEINGNIGVIESMSLRAIEFRHNSGKIQIISFSEINTLINLSRDYSVCSLSIPVDHDANISIIEKIYNDVYEQLKKEPDFFNKIKSEMKFKGLESITENAVYIGANFKTLPDPSDVIGNEFRKRLHLKMQEYSIPYPKNNSIVLKE